MSPDDILTRVGDQLGIKRVFGQPIERDGVTVVPVAVAFGGGGGGTGPDDQGTFCSHVPQLTEYVNTHPNLTVDVGQVLFGETTSMTGDGPLGYYLSNIFKRKWFSCDTELESGCGIVPIRYRNKSLVHSLQWAIGLEWYLLVNDPWRVAMSTDHPNGGSFMASRIR